MTRSKRKRWKRAAKVSNCQYQEIGGHYSCEETELAYRTKTGHLLCRQHALMWLGLLPLHNEDTGLIREIQTMGLRFITDSDGMTAMYDSVTDTAFGPIFYELETAEKFVEWVMDKLNTDPRSLNEKELSALHVEYMTKVGTPE